MPVTTPGQLMIDDALPEDMRGRNRELHAKGIRELAQELATKYPEQYRDVIHKLMKVSSDAMYSSGGYSFGLRHLLPSKAFLAHRQQLEQEINRIAADTTLNEEEKSKRLVELAERGQPEIIKKVFEESLAEKNPLALQIHSGTKGKPFNLMSLVGGDMLYEDQHNRKIPIPVLRSYSEGLRPGEYWAGTYGARKGIVDLKMATQDAGSFSKQLVQAAHRLVVTANDNETEKIDNESPRGLPTDIDDMDNEGALLAHDVGPYKRNTILSPKIIAHLKQLGHERLLVRSPVVGGPADGGVYARDVGVRERGTISPVGDFVGIGAAQSVCLEQNTRVRMADGSVKRICDIEVNDRVLGSDTAGKLRPVKVLQKIDNGIQTCYETVFSKGGNIRISIVSTLTHKILATTGRTHKSAKTEVRPIAKPSGYTRFHAVLPMGTVKDSYYVDDHRGMLLGLLAGSGALVHITGDSFGSSAWKYSNKSVCEYLSGLLATTGFMTDQDKTGRFTIGFRSKSRKLLEHIKALLLFRLGIVASAVRGKSPYVLSIASWEGVNALSKLLDAQIVKGLRLKQRIANWPCPYKRCPANRCTFVSQTLVGERQTYDIYIDHPDHLFVLEEGLTVSNSEPVSQAQIGCLSKGTLVRMASLEVRRIEDIKVGDYVLGADYQGRQTSTRVSFVFDKGSQPCFEATFGETTTITATLNHKLLCSTPEGNKQLPLEQAESAVQLTEHEVTTATKRSMLPLGNLQTYDLEVEHPSHLFVLANGLVVSNSKHTGGVVGAGAGVSGFKAIDQLVQVPKVFPGGATHSQLDGKVQRIVPAPGGGHRVYINDQPHYVGVGLDLKVKPGDTVEAGDMISNGLPNPAEIVAHKGLGEGRMAFIKAFMQTAREANFSLHRRNVELVARGLLNHVVLKEQVGDYLPDDVVPYSLLENSYQPRAGHKTAAPGDAVGHYLEKPVLHHTIGTKLKPSHIEELKKFGVKRVTVHHEPPPFEPEMIRGMANLSYDQDWMTRMLGSNLEKGLLQSVHRGGTSDELGTSYVPSLAKGVEFGKWPPVKGYDPNALKIKPPDPSSLIGGR